MQLNSINNEIKKVNLNKGDKTINRNLFIMGALVLGFTMLLLFYGIDMNHFDYAISKISKVNEFLRQDVNSKYILEEELQLLKDIFEE